jgi:hypothetical protein
MGIYCCLLDLQTNRYQSRIVLIEQVWSANPKASGHRTKALRRQGKKPPHRTTTLTKANN